MPELHLIDYATEMDYSGELYRQEAINRGLTRAKHDEWTTRIETLEDCTTDMEVAYQHNIGGTSAVVRRAGVLARIRLTGGQVHCDVSALDEADIAAFLDILHERLPVGEASDEKRVPLWLWAMYPDGARKTRRMIDVPAWSDIEANYGDSVRGQLETLMRQRPAAGRIVLWSGLPGTGKTFALRSLAYEWRKWCSIHYIVDPDVMFGERSSYLLQVLLDGDTPDGPETPGGVPQWKLLVLEDTGEMLALDAKAHVGQGLSRLLNVTDGLLGQGSRLLTLITTNEDIGRFHPALMRPGRCAARTEFESLTRGEANAWLYAHGSETEVFTAMTLADLYAVLEGRQDAKRESSVGFVSSA